MSTSASWNCLHNCSSILFPIIAASESRRFRFNIDDAISMCTYDIYGTRVFIYFLNVSGAASSMYRTRRWDSAPKLAPPPPAESYFRDEARFAAGVPNGPRWGNENSKVWKTALPKPLRALRAALTNDHRRAWARRAAAAAAYQSCSAAATASERCQGRPAEPAQHSRVLQERGQGRPVHCDTWTRAGHRPDHWGAQGWSNVQQWVLECKCLCTCSDCSLYSLLTIILIACLPATGPSWWAPSQACEAPEACCGAVWARAWQRYSQRGQWGAVTPVRVRGRAWGWWVAHCMGLAPCSAVVSLPTPYVTHALAMRDFKRAIAPREPNSQKFFPLRGLPNGQKCVTFLQSSTPAET